MIPERSTIEHQGNLQGDVARMSIDEAAMAHIMSVLTNLYSDPEGAVLREYSTNAYDAQVEAGVERPIEVVTPTSLAPFLRIKDYGVGMTVDDIHAIYSKYGASTKRGRDDQVGMLGLGCKSALTYADQFTVTSTKGGTRIAISISRDEDGGGSMTVVDSAATDDPDGTEVTIPAKKYHDFERKAQEFFRFWPADSVLVNGREPDRFDGLRVTDTLWLMEQGDSKIVMGNVAYPMPSADFIPSGTALVAFVPIGAVTFPPARESLMMTKNTKAALASIRTEFGRNIRGAVQAAMNAQPDRHSALAEALKWRRHFRLPTAYTYKGEPLPTEYKAKGDRITISQAYSYRLGESYSQRVIDVNMWPGTVWVRGFEPWTFTASHKRKLQAWVEQQDLTGVRYFVMLREDDPDPDPKWIDPERTVDWETVKAIKLPTNSGTGSPQKAIRGSFFGYIDGATQEEIDGKTIDRGKRIFYMEGRKWSGQGAAKQLATLYPGCYFLVLPANRRVKFTRDVPEAKRYDEGIEEAYERWDKKLTDDQRLRLVIEDSTEYSLAASLRTIDPNRVDDPDLKEGHRLASIDVTKLLVERHACGGQRGKRPAWTNPLTKYPLFTLPALHQHPDHVYNYMNAAYAAEQEQA